VKPDPASTAKLRTLGQISPLPLEQISLGLNRGGFPTVCQ
jgi:hypothetical protein